MKTSSGIFLAVGAWSPMPFFYHVGIIPTKWTWMWVGACTGFAVINYLSNKRHAR